MTTLGDMIRRVCEDIRLEEMFAGKSVEDMREIWDSFDEENSFCGPYDCADVHAYMNMIGEGEYCSV